MEFHGLEYDRMLSRLEDDERSDADLRVNQLDEFASGLGVLRENLFFCDCGAQIMVGNFPRLEAD